ncbi:9-hexadecenoic acid cis-trans isomerase [Psychromonas sp. psych-6C06]|uniref:fatty acid cis/trans isomerase n=1 Tax=Psychromonas sp. psych-6C06 TaxID=2058089 RepID=UPI000C32AA8C|nr:fatty acid cis/trans isomerase [Psychromonas sp. psych-6C06]PKF60814.1 9-hexadecenoic acid cis-trans isomerase [Psychromonas sp. psych-6C06]
MNFKILLCAIFSTLLFACSDASEQLNADYGSAQSRDRLLPAEHPLATTFRDEVFPIIEQRCVVCHGCYDAPCQLKLSSPEGIDRGASPAKVYHGTRILAADPTRLFLDAKTTEEWRKKGFSAVLNERDQTADANLDGSLLYQLLEQKQNNPLPQAGRLPEQFDFKLNRETQCVNENTLADYQQEYPLFGMPYGLPPLTADEFISIKNWVAQGAPMSKPEPLSTTLADLLIHWETKFNQTSVKAQLINRYLYEHLFLAHLYFSDVTTPASQPTRFFRLVRSTTPPGQPIDEIATRRPYEDPKGPFFYRLRLVSSTILEKTHMPYALNEKREKRWNALFFEQYFNVDTLPDYSSSNPFIVYEAIPSHLRYQFLLDEAFFTISGFIKGPVCRGSIALNVINDKFWVFFAKPGFTNSAVAEQFLRRQALNLSLPSEASSQSFSVTDWLGYAKRNTKYVQAKSQLVDRYMDYQKGLNLDEVWSGNENAALTVFRHFDSATVLKGSLGKQPKTAWIIDYPVLERIHYLLVAGFDVFGNIGHQVTTRLYMDFLRIESEMNFVSLLPNEDRKPVMASWYLDSTQELSSYLNDHSLLYARPTGIKYQTAFAKTELMSILKRHAYSSEQQNRSTLRYNIPPKDLPLKRLNSLENSIVQQLPEISYLLIESEKQGDRVYSLLRNNAHKNIASLLNEGEQRLPHLDTAEIYPGIIGSYPSLIFRVAERDKRDFINRFLRATNSDKFDQLIARYVVRRSNPQFWFVSDKLHQIHRQNTGVDYGLLDYNRLQNR